MVDSQAASKSLEAYAVKLLVESRFFADLAVGTVRPEHVRDVFAQYYLWRNRFHRWFGVCIAKSAAFGEGLNVPQVVTELVRCLAQEVEEDHHGLAITFMSALGISDPALITALAVTDSYAESFLRYYFPVDRSGDEALAALAGRELAGPSRNVIISRALPKYYGVTSGLELFSLHSAIEAAHFQALWDALVMGTKINSETLIEAARMEIWEHIAFWDDVYSEFLGDPPETKTR